MGAGKIITELVAAGASRLFIPGVSVTRYQQEPVLSRGVPRQGTGCPAGEAAGFGVGTGPCGKGTALHRGDKAVLKEEGWREEGGREEGQEEGRRKGSARTCARRLYGTSEHKHTWGMATPQQQSMDIEGGVFMAPRRSPEPPVGACREAATTLPLRSSHLKISLKYQGRASMKSPFLGVRGLPLPPSGSDGVCTSLSQRTPIPSWVPAPRAGAVSGHRAAGCRLHRALRLRGLPSPTILGKLREAQLGQHGARQWLLLSPREGQVARLQLVQAGRRKTQAGRRKTQAAHPTWTIRVEVLLLNYKYSPVQTVIVCLARRLL